MLGIYFLLQKQILGEDFPLRCSYKFLRSNIPKRVTAECYRRQEDNGPLIYYAIVREPQSMCYRGQTETHSTKQRNHSSSSTVTCLKNTFVVTKQLRHYCFLWPIDPSNGLRGRKTKISSWKIKILSFSGILFHFWEQILSIWFIDCPITRAQGR